MAKSKKAKSARKATGTSTLAAAPPPDQAPPPPDDRILASNLTLHQLFQQQTTATSHPRPALGFPTRPNLQGVMAFARPLFLRSHPRPC